MNELNVHDLLDGEANCLNCGGPCELEGEPLVLSRLVRIAVEHMWAGVPPILWRALTEAGIRKDFLAHLLRQEEVIESRRHKGEGPRTMVERS